VLYMNSMFNIRIQGLCFSSSSRGDTSYHFLGNFSSFQIEARGTMQAELFAKEREIGLINLGDETKHKIGSS